MADQSYDITLGFKNNLDTLIIQITTYTDSNLNSTTVSPTAAGIAGLILGAVYLIETFQTIIVQIKIKSISPSSESNIWRLRSYVLIQYMCYQPACTSCSGPLST